MNKLFTLIREFGTSAFGKLRSVWSRIGGSKSTAEVAKWFTRNKSTVEAVGAGVAVNMIMDTVRSYGESKIAATERWMRKTGKRDVDSASDAMLLKAASELKQMSSDFLERKRWESSDEEYWLQGHGRITDDGVLVRMIELMAYITYHHDHPEGRRLCHTAFKVIPAMVYTGQKSAEGWSSPLMNRLLLDLSDDTDHPEAIESALITTILIAKSGSPLAQI